MQNHIQKLPPHLKNRFVEQISATKEGKRDLQEAEEKAQKQQQKQRQLIENAKESIKVLMAEASMKKEALVLAERLLKLSPEDEELQKWIVQLSE